MYLTTAHERDAESGYDYRGARFYDSEVARFLSLDPLAVKYASLSAYSYVAGNPIIIIDPTGRENENLGGTSSAYENEEEQTEKRPDDEEGKATEKNLWITLSSDKTFIANTNALSSKGGYGAWTVFACSDIAEAAAFLALTPSDYFDNLVINTHGGVMPPKANAPADPFIQTCIEGGKLAPFHPEARYLRLTDFDNKNNSDIGALKTIFSKIKTGGTCVMSSCETGGSEFQPPNNSNKASKAMAQSFYELGGSRFDILLTKGYARIQGGLSTVPLLGNYRTNGTQFVFYNVTLQFPYFNPIHYGGYMGYINGKFNGNIKDVKSSSTKPFIKIFK